MTNYKKNDEAVSPVIGVILMVAVTVILAAVIAAFVFGMAGDIKSGKVVAITAKTIDATHVEFTNMGGQDVGKLTQIDVSGNVTTPGTLGIVTGAKASFTLTGDTGTNSVTVIGVFKDGSTQVLLDTVV